VRGGTIYLRTATASSSGLSPRARGNPALALAAGFVARSIPACAGEPRIRKNTAAKTKVYPRVRGGTLSPTNTTMVASGLSPRARGNRALPRQNQNGQRSIPACAGEPSDHHDIGAQNQVYPRVRGGTPGVKIGSAGEFGLSPRARGNPIKCSDSQRSRRSIPACAGEPAALVLPV